jgi:hypothetical protein
LLRKLIADLIVRARRFWLPSLRKLISDLITLARQVRLPDIGPSLEALRRGVRRPLDRIASQPRLRETLATAAVALDRPIDRWRALRWKLRSTRLGRSADGLLVIPLVVLALVLGVLAATAATNSSSTDGSPLKAAFGASSVGDEVITETVTRNGKTLRIVRYKEGPGSVVTDTVSGRSVTLPGSLITLPGSSVTSTVRDTRTEVVTVTNSVTTTEQVVVISTETQYVTTTEPAPAPPGG